MPNDLTPPLKEHTIDLDRNNVVRLEVNGHYLGTVDIRSGIICLYYRGERAWVDLAEERRKRQTTA